MTAQVYNNVQDTLALSVEDSADQIRVTDGSKFPAVADGDYIPLYVLASNGSYEIMHITAVNGNVLSVERGQENTDTLTFSGGETVQIRLTREALLSIASDSDTDFRTASSYEGLRAMEGIPGEVIYLSSGDKSGFFSYSPGLNDDNGVVVGPWVRVRDDASLAMVEWYGDTAVDVQRALDNNYHIVFKSGKTYYLDRKVQSSDKPVKIDFNNCNIVQTIENDGHCFAIYGGWGEVVPVVSSTEINNYPFVYASKNMNLSRGDIVKISTGMPYEYFKPITAGEFKEVYTSEVGGTKVVFPTQLRFSYKGDGAKISKLLDHKIEILGPVTMRQSGNFKSNSEYRPGSMIRLGSTRDAVIRDIRVDFCYDTAISVWSCYHACIDNLVIGFAPSFQDDRDYSGGGYVGYGIRDCNSTGTHVTNLYAQNCRHGYVAIGSSGSDVGPNSGLSNVGPNMAGNVYDSVAVSCLNSGYDTHHGQEGTRFFNCVSRNGYSAGFQARGVGTEFHVCTSDNDKQVLQAFVQGGYSGDEAITDGTLWKGGSVKNPRENGFRINTDSGQSSIYDVSVEVNKEIPSLARILDISSGTMVLVNNLSLNVAVDNPAMNNFMKVSGSPIVYINGIKGVVRGSSYESFIQNDSNFSISADGIVVFVGRFKNLFSSMPGDGGSIGNIKVNLSETVVAGMPDDQVNNFKLFMGPIFVNRDRHRGIYGG